MTPTGESSSSTPLSVDDVSRLLNLQHEQLSRLIEHTIHSKLTSRDVDVKIATFSGTNDEDVIEFLVNFDRAADFYGWTNAQKALALPLHLEGYASAWFNSNACLLGKSYEELTKALKNQFHSASTIWRLRQELYHKEQFPTESVFRYAADIRRLCHRLELPLSEYVHHFVKGLRPEIKEFVILEQPETLSRAEELAKLKEAVLSMKDDRIDQLLEDMTPLVEQAKNSTIACATADQQQNHPERANGQPVSNGGLDRTMSHICPDSRQLRSNQSLSYLGTPLGNRHRKRVKPICNNCRKSGHVAAVCHHRPRHRTNASFQNRANTSFPNTNRDHVGQSQHRPETQPVNNCSFDRKISAPALDDAQTSKPGLDNFQPRDTTFPRSITPEPETNTRYTDYAKGYPVKSFQMQERMIRRQELKKIEVEIGSLVLSSSDANVCRPTLQSVQDEDETVGSVDPPEAPEYVSRPSPTTSRSLQPEPNTVLSQSDSEGPTSNTEDVVIIQLKEPVNFELVFPHEEKVAIGCETIVFEEPCLAVEETRIEMDMIRELESDDCAPVAIQHVGPEFTENRKVKRSAALKPFREIWKCLKHAIRDMFQTRLVAPEMVCDDSQVTCQMTVLATDDASDGISITGSELVKEPVDNLDGGGTDSAALNTKLKDIVPDVHDEWTKHSLALRRAPQNQTTLMLGEGDVTGKTSEETSIVHVAKERVSLGQVLTMPCIAPEDTHEFGGNVTSNEDRGLNAIHSQSATNHLLVVGSSCKQQISFLGRKIAIEARVDLWKPRHLPTKHPSPLARSDFVACAVFFALIWQSVVARRLFPLPTLIPHKPLPKAPKSPLSPRGEIEWLFRKHEREKYIFC